ncbi:MAG: DUF779 domain-containing protein [Burkholderiales bacterium]|nr:DUF779 domain-containing protein [Burkholderiales bacterium]MDE2159060.1 DUF779 domain-containing protein [Burkholderiales bacterium]MDE2501769.1 DUF779 domain-containing protein [Burkholderiales bacterium]
MDTHVQASDAARALLASLRQRHGAILIYQSHGCCEGSMPMCFAPGEMALNSQDLVLGEIDGTPFWASRAQFEYLRTMRITLDLEPGNAGTFSLEDGSGQHFVVRLQLVDGTPFEPYCATRETGALGAAGAPS